MTKQAGPPFFAKMKSLTAGTCSFCGKPKTAVICAHFTGKSICWECIYVAKVTLGEIPTTAISCYSCGSHAGFTLQYPLVQVDWIFSGVDAQKEIIYTIKNTTNMFQSHYRPTKAVCSKCRAPIPLDILKYNKYVKQAHNA